MGDNVEDFLAHYGVRGMKWGKRIASARNLDQISDRQENKKKLNQLVKDDLYPKRQATLRFLNDSKGPLLALGAGTLLVAKIAMSNQAAGAKAAANILADSKGLPVAGLVKLSYNAATGTWR